MELTQMNVHEFRIAACQEHTKRPKPRPFSQHFNLELNAPAEAIMLIYGLEAADRISKEDADLLLKCMEQGLLQLAFVNECNADPGSAWLNQAVQAGWRYRINKGFHRVAG